MKKIAITTSSFGEYDQSPLDILKKKYEVVLNPYKRKLSEKETVEVCRDMVGIIAGVETLNESVLKELKSLKVISRCGVGMENVDLNAAKKLKIKVFNTPSGPTLSVVELTMGFILNLLRQTYKADADIKDGRWEKRMGNLLYGKKVGIIGFGRIGQKLAELLKAFSCEVAYADPFVNNKKYKKLTLEKLLSWADIISIHAAGKELILSKEKLSLMKKGSWVINVARGEAIDEAALLEALKSGHLAGAALDVFHQEPYQGPLKDLDNVILTPHIGSYAKEARVQMEIESAKNLMEGLKSL